MAPSHPVVLVVDDEPETCAFVELALEPAGYDVECAADAASGLARIAEGGIDLVLLDRMLPDADGLEVCRRVRARGDDLPIVMLTAMVGRPARLSSFIEGAHDYLNKPVEVDELVSCVDTWLGRPRSDSWSR